MYALNCSALYRESVNDHASAERLWRKITPLRGRGEDFPRPLGTRSIRNAKTVRREPDGSIVFRLYRTDVVTYCPDGSLVIEGYRSVSTGSFAAYLTPPGVHLWATSGALLVRPDANYRTWAYDTPCVRCAGGDRVRLVPTSAGGWEPDLETCREFSWETLDRKAGREVAKEYHLSDFTAFIRAYEALTKDRVLTLASQPEIARSLRERDFVTAYHSFPRVIRYVWDRNTQSGSNRDFGISQTSLSKFRAWLYVREDATVTEKAKVLTRGQFESRIKRNRYL